MERETFIDRYATALNEGNAALFIGAGLSRPAGFVDWSELLRDVAAELGLDVDRETDLIAVAQYHVNDVQSRTRLDQAIVDAFTEDATPSEAHRIIARLPVRTIWTTNYDTLIEDAFDGAGKRLDVKRAQSDISITVPRRDAVLYKMHGDVHDPANAILTKDDYETYSERRKAFVTSLGADLLNKTFLFLGFSFTDPNIEYVLARIRGLMGDHQRVHFCLMRPPTGEAAEGAGKAEQEYNQRKFELRVADLKRYSIQTVLVDEYAEVPEILHELDRRVRIRSVFVSGSAHDFGGFGKERLELFLRRLGATLVHRRIRIVSGLGLGVGTAVVLGAMEELYRPGGEELGATEELLALRPFPIGIEDAGGQSRVWTEHRRQLLSESGAAVFVAGNKKDGDNVIEASGVREEFEIALACDVTPIPVGATGFVAASLWEEVAGDRERYFGDVDVDRELEVLGSQDASVEGLVEAVCSILDLLD
jgi:hypothetical protein